METRREGDSPSRPVECISGNYFKINKYHQRSIWWLRVVSVSAFVLKVGGGGQTFWPFPSSDEWTLSCQCEFEPSRFRLLRNECEQIWGSLLLAHMYSHNSSYLLQSFDMFTTPSSFVHRSHSALTDPCISRSVGLGDWIALKSLCFLEIFLSSLHHNRFLTVKWGNECH